MGSASVLLGVALNRTNVALLAYRAPAGAAYHPYWMEVLIATAAVGAGVLIFVLAVRFLPILPETDDEENYVVPRWSRRVVIFVSGALTLLTIAVVLILQPITQSGTSKAETVGTTPEALVPREGQCQACHQDQALLADAGATTQDIDLLTIEPLPAEATHGDIRCVACHFGDESTLDAEVAHEGVILDATTGDAEMCLACHPDLPTEIPEDRLRTPHDEFTHGASSGVACSDCHGAVGHGFDPVSHGVICPMSVCVDCHVELQLDSALTDCAACHISPHDPVPTQACSVCHQSTDQWQEVGVASHPVDLEGAHAKAACTDCHEDGSFEKVVSTNCADCHQPPSETHYGPVCEDCHTPTSFRDASMPVHPVELTGNHQNAACAGCHVDGQASPDMTTCSTCHERPENHLPGDCTICHTPYGWTQSVSLILQLTPPITHGVEGRENCLTCHDVASEMKPAPCNHQDYSDEQCVLCHKVSD
jgi:hypothetical protein